MKRALAWLALVTACGDPPYVPCQHELCEYDSNLDTFHAVYCDPATQTGCGAGKKCTWIDSVQEGDAPPGVGCVPDGSVPLGSACATNADGYDDCARGGFCNGTCEAICTFATIPTTCGAGTACVREPSLYVEGLTTEGLCEPTCDPLADNDFDESGSALSRSGSACGAPSNGCYGVPSEGTRPPTTFSCYYDFNAATPLHHRSECIENCVPFGLPMKNSCNQGYEPVLRESTAVSTVICVALCAPLDCYAGNCGSNDVNRVGAPPHRCNAIDARGSFGSGEECQFLWSRELDGSGHWLPSPYSNSVGICVDRDIYGEPRCNTLPLAQAAGQGCVSTATAGVQP